MMKENHVLAFTNLDIDFEAIFKKISYSSTVRHAKRSNEHQFNQKTLS